MTPPGPALHSATDASLIAASVRRPERFATVFDRHFKSIHHYLARRAGRDLADDLASQCFTVAFARRGSFDGTAVDARPWLYGIATNLLRDHWRERRRSVVTVVRLTGDRSRVAQPDPAARDHTDPELARALRSLDSSQLDVLLLYAWAELSYEEIAVALGVPVGTVRSRLARARARVRAELNMDTDTERISSHERRA